MVRNGKYEEFENKANTISFQMIFAIGSRCKIAAKVLPSIQELKEPNAS